MELDAVIIFYWLYRLYRFVHEKNTITSHAAYANLHYEGSLFHMQSDECQVSGLECTAFNTSLHSAHSACHGQGVLMA
jgi:hypothetical protein